MLSSHTKSGTAQTSLPAQPICRKIEFDASRLQCGDPEQADNVIRDLGRIIVCEEDAAFRIPVAEVNPAHGCQPTPQLPAHGSASASLADSL